jgi:hypothetical protein
VHREFSVSANYSSNNFAAKTKALLKTTHSTALRAWFLRQPFCFARSLKSLAETKKDVADTP